MLSFKEITLNDREELRRYMYNGGELSCESAFYNLLTWGKIYRNMYAVCDGQMIIRSNLGDREIFRLPFGNDFHKGMALIKEYCGEHNPTFWVQEGERLSRFLPEYSTEYALEEKRDASDYIYSREALADLAGKKYHSKRNHIAAFSREFDWHFEPLTDGNTEKIRECAEKWYAENGGRMDKYMQIEKDGIDLLLSKRETFGVLGGGIFVGEQAVAFTLGTAISEKMFDTHAEKALADYRTAYTVINNAFAKNVLTGFEYINREDDMGLEGLRRAKLSYHPQMILKKYSCVPKVKT